jgi:predicted AAA+ superfamily ATPase
MVNVVKRRFWMEKIESAWGEKSVIWLSGVRRAGKTFLSQSLPDVEYFDCELPSTRRMMEDPEAFLSGLAGKRVALDEIHRLENPSQLLKIAADHFPDTRVLAIGSSTLGASKRFRDTLTGRKIDLWLTPMMTADLEDFGDTDLGRRFLRGGLPPFFLAAKFPERDFQAWADAFWAKDIQELFRLERRASFQRFIELLLAQSGGIFQALKFAQPCEVSRTTISNYLAVLEATFVVHVVRPFSHRRRSEIIAAPKVFGFDTGFVCYYSGWSKLRREDMGNLWEHLVLNQMQATLQTRRIQYWRTKQGHEIDFVYAPRGERPVAIECKWSVDEFAPKNLLAFRRQYPSGRNYLVAQDVKRVSTRKFGNVAVDVVDLAGLIRGLQAPADAGR